MKDKDLEKVAKIVELEKQLEETKQATGNSLNEQIKSLKDANLIAEYQNITLYKDRIEGDGRTISLKHDVQASVECGGQITYTPVLSGGKDRPTLTRVAAGGLIAGPIGAVVGMTAQKKQGFKTDVQTNDDRTVILTIASSKEGYITRTLSGTEEAKARNFATQILNALIDFHKGSKGILADIEKNEKEIKNLRKSDPVAALQKEIDALTASLPESMRDDAPKLGKSISSARTISIVGLCFSITPIFGFIMPLISLMKAIKLKKYGIKDKRIQPAYIMSIIGLVVCAIMTLWYLIDGGSNTTTPTA